MKTTRHGVFETNSSSTHSISINRSSGLMTTMIPESGNTIIIRPDEFGWGPSTHTDPETKASYVWTHILNYSGEYDYKEMLRHVIMDHTGYYVLLFSMEDGSTGYIDHQSQDVAMEVLEDEKTLRSFIFNPSSVLEITNDNE